MSIMTASSSLSTARVSAGQVRITQREKDEINVPMALSVFRDDARSMGAANLLFGG